VSLAPPVNIDTADPMFPRLLYPLEGLSIKKSCLSKLNYTKNWDSSTKFFGVSIVNHTTDHKIGDIVVEYLGETESTF
jgi:hypothetical protein